MGTQHEKAPRTRGLRFSYRDLEVSLELDDVTRLKLAVLARGDVEGYRSTLIQSLETVHLNLREVNEQVLAVALRDEAVTLLGLNHLTVPSAISLSSFLSPSPEGKPNAAWRQHMPNFYGHPSTIRYISAFQGGNNARPKII